MRWLIALLFLCSVAEAQVIVPGQSIVNNNGMAFMPPNTVKCNPQSITAKPSDCAYPILNATDFGAIGNGSTDDTAAIQSAVNACPVTGCYVGFPQTSSCYKTSSAITIGNGTNAPSVSTRQGVILGGWGVPTQLTIGALPQFGGPRICLSVTNSPVIVVNGPLQGFGIQGLVLDCQSNTGTIGVQVHSGVYGDSSNLTIKNCGIGISEASYVGFGSLHNSWRNIFISVLAAANAQGIVLDGDGVGTTSNTSFSHYSNVTIFLPATLTTFGVNLRATDSDQFYNLHIAGGSGTAIGLQYDYTAGGVNGGWPANTAIYGLEPSESIGASVAISGTPGVGAQPNFIYSYDQDNGAVCPVNTPNLSVYCQSAISLATPGNGANTTLTALKGHMSVTTNAAPTITAGCNGAGSSLTAQSTDNAGVITGQTAAATTCTLTFARPFNGFPACTANGANGAIQTVAANLTTLVLTFASTASWVGSYICIGN